MAGSPWSRVLAALLATVLALGGLLGLVLLAPNAQAATWMQDTDADFNAGTLSGTEVVGTGSPAVVSLIKDATDWRNENPASNPGQREGPAMAYDSANGVAVLFGGYDGINHGDTWEYTPSTNTWVQTSSTGPSPRAYPGMAFDSGNGTIVLFGGVSDADSEFDTWEYNAGTDTWYQTTPGTSPPRMGSYHLTYDSANARVILVGQSLVTAAMETWAYDTTADTWQNRIASFSPARSGQGIAYFPAQSRVVLFGGAFLFTLYGDTWEYNYVSNTWTNTVPDGSGPSARTAMGLSYRTTDSSIWMFGGNTGSPSSETWRYFDFGGTRQWVQTPTQRSPAPRHTFAMTDQATASLKSFIYGGLLNGGGRASDTWSLGPAYRSTGFFTSMTFDSSGANADWNTLSWAPTAQPAQTTLRFQVAASNDPTGPWNYLGPNCAPITYYTTSGTATCTSLDNNRYLRVIGQFLSSDNLNTPTMDSFTVDYTVAASDPYLVSTDPASATFDVPQSSVIFIRFSETMNIGTVTVTVSPATSTTPSWSESNSALTLTPASSLLECKAYTVTVTAGQDTAGNNLNNGLNLVPNPFSFVTECINPTITATDPPQGMMDVPLNAPIVIDFSEPMDTATVAWTITPAVSTAFSWSNGNQRLTLTHAADFSQCTMHEVNVTAGDDLAGLPLFPGGVPNPWDFHSICTIPFIFSTVPSHLATGVSGSADIVVTFSEPMQPATVTYTISPVTVLTPAWSGGNTVLTLSHTVPWSACTMVTTQITGGKDVDGNDLFPGQHESHAPNPWKFAVTCASPFIVVTVPMDGDTGVDQFAEILIQFSEPMNTASVVVLVNPAMTLTPTWDPQGMFLRLNHATPFSCGLNTFTVSGQDVDGNSMVPGLQPNPFSFSPNCPNPFIVSTNPANDATGIALTADIAITFSEPMNTATVTWDVFPAIGTTFVWTIGNTVLTLSHSTNFAQSTQYTVVILSGQDADQGNDLIAGPVPNPWRFITVGVNPVISSTDPVDGTTDVPTASNVVITFSEPMDTATVTVTPNPAVFLGFSWDPTDTTLTVSHITNFAECTGYVFTVGGNDKNGDPLVNGPVPNPFDFTTVCFAPFITDTNPANGAVNYPVAASIWVNFSEPMNRVTVTAVLVPAAGVLSYAWTNGDTTLEITHATNLLDCTTYQATVSGQDVDGNSLVGGPAPNPWTFGSFCPSPIILSTLPANGATNVPLALSVVVTFSRAMDTTVSVTFISFAPAVTGLAYSWSGGDTVMTVTHNAFTDCTSYQATVTGRDTNGNALIAGPAPNPWSFSTVCTVSAPGNLQVARIAPANIRLTWNAVTGADNYRVFTAADRFASWPWTVLGNTATPSFDATGHLSDGATHYYIVRAMRGTTESPNSTMGVKIARSFSFASTTTNVHWFSLPYRSPYARASDIAAELTNARIDVIGKWNPVTQSPILYYYFRGAWRGTDFTIGAGDGLYVGAVSAFSWALVGTDRAVTLTFTRNTPPLGNVNWISVPYTGTYRDASDLVLDIEGSLGGTANTKIVEVVKWDSASQSLLRFFWTVGGWTGNDFALAPGDAVFFNIVANFSWQPDLVTPEVP